MKGNNPSHKESSSSSLYSVCWKGPLPEPSVRIAEDLRGVLANPECTCKGPVYYMYRDLACSVKDRNWLTEQQLRFDITVIHRVRSAGSSSRQRGIITRMIHQVPATLKSMKSLPGRHTI